MVQMIVKCLPRAVQLSPFKCSSGTSTEITANDQKVKGNAGKAEEKEKRKKTKNGKYKDIVGKKILAEEKKSQICPLKNIMNLKTFQAQVLLFCQYCPCTGRRQYRRTNTKTNGHTTSPPLTTINTL